MQLIRNAGSLNLRSTTILKKRRGVFGLPIARKKLWLLIVAVLVLLVSPTNAADKVTLQLRWDHQYQFAGYYAAKWQGYYADVGLDVEIRPSFTKDWKYLKASEEVATGRVEFGVTASDLLSSSKTDASFVVLASIFQESPLIVYGLVNTKLDSPSDLKGLNLGMFSRGNIGETEIRVMMAKVGLDPERDFPNITIIKNGFKDITDGQVDVAVGYTLDTHWFENSASQIINTLKPSTYGIEFYGDTLFTRRSLIEQKPELVKAFVEASIKGWRYALTHGIEIADRISSDLPRKVPVSDLKAFNRFQIDPVKQLTHFPVIPLGQNDPQRWRNIHASMKTAGVVFGTPPGDDFIFDPQREADKRLQIWTVGLLIFVFFVAGAAVIAWIITLRRAVANRTAEIKANEETLFFISQRGWEKSGGNFFDSLVTYLGKTLDVDFVFVDVLSANEKVARTVSLYALGKFPGNIEYDLEWTPCENVIGKNLCCYPERIKELFPKDKLLVDMGAESYVGIPLWDSKRKPIGLIAVMDRKPLPNPQRIKSILQLVAARTAQELERAQIEENLTSAKAEAEQANQAKSEFLASMSHDLRTPLNAILGFSDMMREKTFGSLGDPHYESYANDIYDSGTLLVSLINDILDLSKIEAGKYELVEKPLDILKLIQTSFRQLKKIAETSNQTLSTCVPPEFPAIRGDERALIQIFNNLLSNAIKFTPNSGKIDVEASLDKDNSIVISVSDTGIGMSESGKIKALQPFEQADGLHSRRHEGTGLGLHLCVNLMKLFGGTLNIESEVDKGTTVILRFPPERTVVS